MSCSVLYLVDMFMVELMASWCGIVALWSCIADLRYCFGGVRICLLRARDPMSTRGEISCLSSPILFCSAPVIRAYILPDNNTSSPPP
ncbi:hypothetical protein BDV95DRAFT_393879 [Massariosphaeria phaeospora]|uniref:Uncharacterized protein n=1 Tax=Massariosphaeria phaeospora TaxID=100035 RepID=A0A7C8M9U7_9PLEO|nr:hypothetical protein BDV95DRAFT_393879 [Massariosphaeria phaeospora]